jgi:hypothetical protein
VSGPQARLGRRQTGERLGGFIYGTIIVLAVVVAGARAYEHEAGHIAGLVSVTVLVFWLAHVYSHALAHAVGHDEHLSLAELRGIAHREASILEAAVPPLAALLLGAFGILSTKLAVWVAVVLGLVVLCAQGITFARVERLGRLGSLAVVAANLGLGVALVGLKLLVSH